MRKKVFLSVIIPIYNAEKFLSECIDSVLNQEYKNFEIILINDGSTDNSGNICDYYANSYSNITVIHQKNQGVSFARNVGLEKAKGDYICFIDADDYILPNYFITINNAENEYDILRFENTHYEYNSKLYNPWDFIINKHSSSTLWVYAFKTEIINKYNIRFPNNITHSEDFCFVTKIISVSKIIKDYNKRFYQYQHNPLSAIHKTLTHKAADSHLSAITDIVTFFQKNNISENKLYKVIIQNCYFYFALLLKIPYKNFSYKHAKHVFDNFTNSIRSLNIKDLNILYIKYNFPFIIIFIYSICKFLKFKLLHIK